MIQWIQGQTRFIRDFSHHGKVGFASLLYLLHTPATKFPRGPVKQMMATDDNNCCEILIVEIPYLAMDVST